MTTVAEVLRQFDVDLTESDVAEALATALRAAPGIQSAPLTEAEVEYLAEHAGPGAARAIAEWGPEEELHRRAVVAASAVGRLTTGTLSIAQVAKLIGVDRSRVSHRLSAGRLYSVTIAGHRRVPAWQFHAGAELPGLAEVVAAIPSDVHPLDVQALMTTPQAELADRTPIEHLATGGAPAAVAELIADLGWW